MKKIIMGLAGLLLIASPASAVYTNNADGVAYSKSGNLIKLDSGNITVSGTVSGSDATETNEYVTLGQVGGLSTNTLNATGVTDGYVLTADGADSFGWEAAAGGSGDFENTTALAVSNILFIGDSNTADDDGAYDPDPAFWQSVTQWIDSATAYVCATSGWTLVDMNTHVAEFDGYPGAGRDVAVILGGVNDANSVAASTMLTRLQNLVASSLADGWDEIIFVTYPGWPGLESRVSEFNRLASGWCINQGHRVVDFAAVCNDENGTMKDRFVWSPYTASSPNGSWFHLNQAAADILAEMIYGAINDQQDAVFGLAQSDYGINSQLSPSLISLGYYTEDASLPQAFTPRVAGRANDTAFIVCSGTYADASKVSTGMVLRVTSGSLNGDFWISSGPLTSGADDFPIENAVSGDTYFEAVDRTLGADPSSYAGAASWWGRPIFRVDMTDSTQHEACILDVTAHTHHTAGSTVYQLRTMVRNSGTYPDLENFETNTYSYGTATIVTDLSRYIFGSAVYKYAYVVVYNTNTSVDVTSPLGASVHATRSNPAIGVMSGINIRDFD